jgi:hypothetical protein
VRSGDTKMRNRTLAIAVVLAAMPLSAGRVFSDEADLVRLAGHPSRSARFGARSTRKHRPRRRNVVREKRAEAAGISQETLLQRSAASLDHRADRSALARGSSGGRPRRRRPRRPVRRLSGRRGRATGSWATIPKNAPPTPSPAIMPATAPSCSTRRATTAMCRRRCTSWKAR